MPCYTTRQITQAETFQSMELLKKGMMMSGLTLTDLRDGIEFEGWVKANGATETHRVAGSYRVDQKGNGTISLTAGSDPDFNLIRVMYARAGVAAAQVKYGFKMKVVGNNEYLLEK